MKSNSGFSLIEVMIVLSILMIAALGFSTFMKNASNQQRQAEVRNSMTVLNSQVQAQAIDAQAIYNSMDERIEVKR
jgi:prepilin-type N-terminal cleavage/methylation domain-containing protein